MKKNNYRNKKVGTHYICNALSERTHWQQMTLLLLLPFYNSFDVMRQNL